MQDTDTPIKIPLPWANGAGPSYITYPVPTASQIGITTGAASYTDGFPPVNFLPLAGGGVAPFGKDFNGALKQATAGLQWLQAGAPLYFDAGFAAGIGGYPKGTVLSSASTLADFWISEVDNNTANPDTGGANWLAVVLPNALQLAQGECYLQYSSATQIILNRHNGQNIIINGVQYAITPQPTAGLTGVYVNGVAGQNLAANTSYLVSASIVAGVITLKFWNAATYAHLPDFTGANLGTEVISLSGVRQSPDTLVGFVRTNATPNFQAQGVGTMSWFNDTGVSLGSAISGTATTTAVSPALVELTTALRITFCSWANRPIQAIGLGLGSNDNATGNQHGSGIAIDVDGSAFSFSGNAPAYSAFAGNGGGVVAAAMGTVSEGSHYISLFGFVDPGGSGTTATLGPLSVNLTVRG